MLATQQNYSNSTKLYSFDIFDTLITRTVAYPGGIFTLMQHSLQNDSDYRMFPDFLKNNFYTIRIEAESFIRTNKFATEAKQDITLKDIYEIIKINNNLSNEDIEKLIDLEISTEIRNIKAIPQNISLVKDLINQNKRVILISDMYHTKDVLLKILGHIDVIFSGIKIYVSSELGITKHFGDLYEFVSKEENVNYSNWVHYGDNKYADIKQAKLKNITPILLEQEAFMPYEEDALKTLEEDYSVEALIGLAKMTRTLNKRNSKVYSFAVSYAGPILYNYVNWVIEQAISRGIETLHFIARDGYVLKKTADIILKEKNINKIKTKYIYGSRIAWRIPDEYNIDEYINFICDEYHDRCTLEFLAKRFNISIDFLLNYSKTKDKKRVLKLKEIKYLKNNLLKDNDFKKHISDINKEKKALLIEYLKQELDLTKNYIAFVDVHGSGRTQDMLKNIISNFSSNEILGFYFHTDFNCTQNISKKISYLSTGKYIHHAIELLCRNLDGQTIGYDKDINNKAVPILEEIDSTNLLNWGYKDYLDGLCDFCVNACKFEQENKISLQSYSLYKNYFVYLTQKLDKETANIMGSIPYQEVGSEKKGLEAAPEYKIKNSIKYIITGKLDGELSFITLSRSSKIFNTIYKNLEKYGSLRKFLIDVYICSSKKRVRLTFLGLRISFSI